jgi:predicted NAD/FAD-binding protein
VDLLSKEHNRLQSELPADTTMNKQWPQVSYYHQKTPSHEKSLQTTLRILPQHIPETSKKTTATIILPIQQVNQTEVSDKGISLIRRTTDLKVVKYT